MNFLKGISLFCICIIAVVAIGVGIGFAFPEKITLPENETIEESVTFEEAQNVIANAARNAVEDIPKENEEKQKQVYYLQIVDQEIVVYHSQDDSIFMNTGIMSHQIPDKLLEEIYKHKGFDRIEDVYDFLESYSS